VRPLDLPAELHNRIPCAICGVLVPVGPAYVVHVDTTRTPNGTKATSHLACSSLECRDELEKSCAVLHSLTGDKEDA